MLRITKRSEYGLMALAHMASRPRSYCSVREIVERLGVPRRLLAEVLKDLSHARLVESVRGPGGGYRLRRDSIQISLADLVEVLEGPLQVIGCSNGGECGMEPSCVIREGMSRVASEIHGVLERFTLADLAASSSTLRSPPQSISPPQEAPLP